MSTCERFPIYKSRETPDTQKCPRNDPIGPNMPPKSSEEEHLTLQIAVYAAEYARIGKSFWYRLDPPPHSPPDPSGPLGTEQYLAVLFRNIQTITAKTAIPLLYANCIYIVTTFY